MSHTDTLEPAITRSGSQPPTRTSAIRASTAAEFQHRNNLSPDARGTELLRAESPETQHGADHDSTDHGGTNDDGANKEGANNDRATTDRANKDGTDNGNVANWAYVDAAQNGDSDAFGQLYAQYAHVVYRYVLFRVSDHCLAEDITSETFLRALRRIASVTYQGRDVAAWFITIAKNLVLDHIKSSRNRLEIPTYELAHSSPTPSSQLGPEHHVLAAATQVELLRCVRALNPDQRECIRLRFGQGLSVTETARLMQRNEGAIKALQHRAVRRLGQLLPDDPR